MTLAMLPVTAVQYMCAKIGPVTGRGLSGVLWEHYPRALCPAVIALVIASTLNAGADIGAIAAAINLLVPIPAIIFIVPVSLGIIGPQAFGSYRLISTTTSSLGPCVGHPTSGRVFWFETKDVVRQRQGVILGASRPLAAEVIRPRKPSPGLRHRPKVPERIRFCAGH